MKSGSIWYELKFWHDDDDYTPYRVKIAYEIEPGHYEDGRYYDGYSILEIEEYPDGASESLKASLRDKVDELSDYILMDISDNEEDYEHKIEAERENKICNDIDNSFLNP